METKKLEFIIDFLAHCEDHMHGPERDACRQARKYLLEMVSERDAQKRKHLQSFVDWWGNLSQDEFAWYEDKYVQVFEATSRSGCIDS